MEQTVEQFYRYKYDVPTSVYNGVLTFGIMKSKENDRLPNIVYLRKVMETFVNTGIKTTGAVVKFFEDYKSFQNQKAKKKHVANAEPEYMDDVMKRWEAEEKALGNDPNDWVKNNK
jgi:replication initiation and membrane attachment protein DnaB